MAYYSLVDLIISGGSVKLTNFNKSVGHTDSQPGVAGVISAFRPEYSGKENRQRARSLLAKLMARGYRIYSIGSDNSVLPDPSGAGGSSQTGFCVLSRNERQSENLKIDLAALAAEFGQDSIIIIAGDSARITPIASGLQDNSGNEARRMSDDGRTVSLFPGQTGGFPVGLKEIEYPGTINGLWALKILANKDWRDMDA